MSDKTPISSQKLSAYKAKRNFRKSPEPSVAKRNTTTKAKASQRPPAPRFCVQKHLASHLHYDFRLEHAGVLLSWAVPKWPSLRPSHERFSIRVDDGPIESSRFKFSI